MRQSDIEPSSDFTFISISRPGANISLDHLLPDICETCSFEHLPMFLRCDSDTAVESIHAIEKKLCPLHECGICWAFIIVTSGYPVNLDVLEEADAWGQVPSEVSVRCSNI